jgi:hypothetical protein
LLADLPMLRHNEKFIPDVVNVPMSGSFDAPKIDLVGAVTKSLIPGFGSGKPEDLIKSLPDLINQARGGGKKDKSDKNGPSGDEPISRDPKAAADSAPDKAKPRDDTVGELLDLAGGLLNKNKKKDKKDNEKDMRDQRDNPPRSNDLGNERISSEPPPRANTDAGAKGDARISGDQPISADPRAARPATNPSTAPATQRNVSGRTRDARDGK